MSMEPSQSLATPSPLATPQVAEKLRLEVEELLHSLPKEKGWMPEGLCQYEGLWYPPRFLLPVISFQRHFEACDDDIMLASSPKSGTTWLKAIIFSIVNRKKYTISNTPLLTENPHKLVPAFETDLYLKEDLLDIASIPSPKLFGTHIIYESLPTSIKQTDCKIVYICRSPFDMLASAWHFLNQIKVTNAVKFSLEQFVELFSKGIHSFGPFWDHMLSFWNESLRNPNKILFLKYEDLKEDPNFYVKKLAEFLGFPFSTEEEENGVIEEIINICSIGSLKDLEVNKSGKYHPYFENKVFFRKGEVGDSMNLLTPSMVDALKQVMDEKFSGSGLTFKTN